LRQAPLEIPEWAKLALSISGAKKAKISNGAGTAGKWLAVNLHQFGAYTDYFGVGPGCF